MKIKGLEIAAGLKLSKHYQTCESRISLSVELEDDDDVVEVKDEISGLIHSMVDEEIAKGLTSLEEK